MNRHHASATDISIVRKTVQKLNKEKTEWFSLVLKHSKSQVAVKETNGHLKEKNVRLAVFI